MSEEKKMDTKLAEALKSVWDSLTDEQKEKARACKTMDELVKLAGKEGVELPDEVLDAVAGGYIHYTQYGNYEIIEDRSGCVLEILGSNACFSVYRRAEQLGQSSDYITTDNLQKLREDARGC